MRVNIYDEENIQKGRLMLMNIAEDLKEYAKIVVSPMESDSKFKEKQELIKQQASGAEKTAKKGKGGDQPEDLKK